MALWIILFLCDLSLPLMMIVFGWLMRTFSISSASRSFGYRSSMSCRSADTWYYANRTCGTIWFWGGIITLLPTILVHIPFMHSSENTLGILSVVAASVLAAVMLLPCVYVEIQLHRHFDRDGNPR